MTVYYNENDPKAAAWLRELMRAGAIPRGVVDERSIENIAPADLAGYTQCHFFAGIGGWPYALRLAGWPDDRPVWTGSCPCQPFSVAGDRGGVNDPRHLWPIWRWLIDQRRPATILGEQVASRDGRTWFAGVRADLEALGYARGGADLCAAGVGAPHIRQRLFWMAYHQGIGWREGCEDAPGRTEGARSQGSGRRLADNGGSGRLADADANGQRAASQPSDDDRERNTESRRGVGDAKCAGLEGHTGHVTDGHEPGRQHTDAPGPIAEARRNSWQGIYIPCADGKARRIESGLEPLVNGLPGRVGLLRGYGNAIVPEVAATFIEAAIDSLPHRGNGND